MVCRTVTLPDGVRAIACGPRRRSRRCKCGRPASLLCDWKVEAGRTCDAPLCAECTHKPADGKDLCPTHAERWLRHHLNGHFMPDATHDVDLDVLRCAQAGRSLYEDCPDRPAYTARSILVARMEVRDGWIDRERRLTPAGERELARREALAAFAREGASG